VHACPSDRGTFQREGKAVGSEKSKALETGPFYEQKREVVPGVYCV
jgi:hypothetical protein